MPSANELGLDLLFRWRNAAFLAAALIACALPAQRLALPVTPFDYSVPKVEFAFWPTSMLPIRGTSSATHKLWAERSQRLRVARRDQRATLGRVLFYETALSGDGRRSCASCHRQERAFTDGLARSRGVHGRRAQRNAMSTVNLAYHRGAFFWDGREQRLEDVVLQPIENPAEMGSTVDEVLVRLREKRGLVELFRSAFGDGKITRERLGNALAAFVRSIVSFGSRYDEGLAAVKGKHTRDFPNFTAAENRGKAVFFGIGTSGYGSCAMCHVAAGMGCCGNVLNYFPAQLQGQRMANNGIDSGVAGDDPGLGGITGRRGHVGRFRTPTLRNIAVTAPYMHDGRMRTLEEVVDFYATRVRPHRNLDLPLTGATGGCSPTRPRASVPVIAGDPTTIVDGAPGMPMTRQQRRDLVAFLKTLTDEALLADPRFSDPFVR